MKLGFIDKLANPRTEVASTRLYSLAAHKPTSLKMYPRKRIEADFATMLSRIMRFVFFSALSLSYIE